MGVGALVEILRQVTQPVDAGDEHTQLAVHRNRVTYPLAIQDKWAIHARVAETARIFSSAYPVPERLSSHVAAAQATPDQTRDLGEFAIKSRLRHRDPCSPGMLALQDERTVDLASLTDSGRQRYTSCR